MPTGRVIKLDDYRRSPAPPGTADFEFPTLYRVTGYYSTVPDHIAHPTPADEEMAGPAPPHYTLCRDDAGGLCNPTWTPISAPQPGLDTGCITVRHHSSLDRAQGYQTGLLDAVEAVSFNQNLFETTQGVFTVHQRQATERNDPPLLVFARHEPHPHPNIGSVETRLATRADGTTFDPDDVELDP